MRRRNLALVSELQVLQLRVDPLRKIRLGREVSRHVGRRRSGNALKIIEPIVHLHTRSSRELVLACRFTVNRLSVRQRAIECSELLEQRSELLLSWLCPVNEYRL